MELTPRAWLGYVQIARIDHWIKNLFVLPGFVVALSIERGLLGRIHWPTVLIGGIALCLTTSSNYALNEILDAPADRLHPDKTNRPIASGRVSSNGAYVEWIALTAAVIVLFQFLPVRFNLALIGLWVAGCAYNVRPLRTKDIPYVDVLSEAINNPLRMLAGWYLTSTVAIPITTLLVSYWMVGCYFMAIKRFAEFRELSHPVLEAYRPSFRHYSEQNLLSSILFYGSNSMLFFGAFIIRYRLELILSFPLVAMVMAIYFWLAFRPRSPVQHPERLYREPLVIFPTALCAVAMTAFLFVDVPWLYRLFPPTQVQL